MFGFLQREFYRHSSNPRATGPQLVDSLDSWTGFCKIQFTQIANCLLDAVFTCFYFVSLATVSIPVAAIIVVPNNQFVLVVFTQFVCRIYSQMNSKLTEEYRDFLLQSLWKKSDKPEVTTAVVSNKVSQVQPPIRQAIHQLKARYEETQVVRIYI